MDAFFAAVEMRDNPKLRNVPMAVGGASDRRGVLSTSNYLARKFGVRSAMPTSQAMKLCPNLVLVKPNFKKYQEASEQIFEIFHSYTDLVEGLSLDEAFLDVTDAHDCHGSATLIAKEIRKEIFEATGLTASAGIASNKLIAKLASDVNKPNGPFTVAPHQIDSFIKAMPVERIWGVGKVTAGRMTELGIRTCADLQRRSLPDLMHYFGKFGETLYYFSRGQDDREVETDYERKSLGTEETFSEDLSELSIMREQVSRLFYELKDSLEHYPEKSIKNIHVKIKYFDFKLTTIERQLPVSEEAFLQLLEERWFQNPQPVRLLGVGVKFVESKLASSFQLPLLA